MGHPLYRLLYMGGSPPSIFCKFVFLLVFGK